MGDRLEVWKDLPGYEGLYKVSNLGRVRNTKKILNPYKGTNSYKYIRLTKNRESRRFSVHRLVYFTFNTESDINTKLVVHHKDGIRDNNNLDNLSLITQRENTYYNRPYKSSKYIGVSLSSKTSKWESSINLKGKNYHLGTYNKELDAHKAYLKALSDFNILGKLPAPFKRKNKFKGVTKSGSKWSVNIFYNRKTYYLGTFSCIHEARDLYLIASAERQKGNFPTKVTKEYKEFLKSRVLNGKEK